MGTHDVFQNSKRDPGLNITQVNVTVERLSELRDYIPQLEDYINRAENKIREEEEENKKLKDELDEKYKVFHREENAKKYSAHRFFEASYDYNEVKKKYSDSEDKLKDYKLRRERAISNLSEVRAEFNLLCVLINDNSQLNFNNAMN